MIGLEEDCSRDIALLILPASIDKAHKGDLLQGRRRYERLACARFSDVSHKASSHSGAPVCGAYCDVDHSFARFLGVLARRRSVAGMLCGMPRGTSDSMVSNMRRSAACSLSSD